METSDVFFWGRGGGLLKTFSLLLLPLENVFLNMVPKRPPLAQKQNQSKKQKQKQNKSPCPAPPENDTRCTYRIYIAGFQLPQRPG